MSFTRINAFFPWETPTQLTSWLWVSGNRTRFEDINIENVSARWSGSINLDLVIRVNCACRFWPAMWWVPCHNRYHYISDPFSKSSENVVVVNWIDRFGSQIPFQLECCACAGGWFLYMELSIWMELTLSRSGQNCMDYHSSFDLPCSLVSHLVAVQYNDETYPGSLNFLRKRTMQQHRLIGSDTCRL